MHRPGKREKSLSSKGMPFAKERQIGGNDSNVRRPEFEAQDVNWNRGSMTSGDQISSPRHESQEMHGLKNLHLSKIALLTSTSRGEKYTEKCVTSPDEKQ